MSRERMVDPAIYSSEQFCDVSRDARYLFIGLIVKSDDCGLFSASPHTLRLEVFPTDDLTKDDVRALRGELEGVGLVQRYAVGETEYLWLPRFFEWQRLRYRSNTKRLKRLVEAGVFQAEYDKNNRPTKVWPTNPNPVRTRQDRTGFTEERRGEERGEEKRGENSPPLRLCREAATKGPIHEPASGIVQSWNGNGDFRLRMKLFQVMKALDEKQPELLLAHVLEVDRSNARSKSAMLYKRIAPGGTKKPLSPSEAALRVAKSRLYPDAPEDRGGGTTALRELLPP